MSGDGPKPSLAEEAAAWVPPWARQAAPADAAAGADAEVELPAPAQPADAGPPVAVEDAGDADDAGQAPADAGQTPKDAGDADDAGQAPADAGQTPKDAGGADDARQAPARLDPAELRGALEAILLVVDEPVTEATLAQVVQQPVELVGATLEALAEEYAGRGFELRRAAGGWRLYTRPAFASYVERFVLDGQQVRLTQASLETLAVVAYKQPVTRSRISAIRGVNCDGVIRTLVSRGLIEECGSEPETGALLYRTTSLFLEKLGMDSVAELPPLAPFLPDDINEIADAPPR